MHKLLAVCIVLCFGSPAVAENFYAAPDRGLRIEEDLPDRSLQPTNDSPDQSVRLESREPAAPGWVQKTGGLSGTIDCPLVARNQFQGSLCWVKGLGYVPFTNLVTVTRASQETCSDAFGNLTYAANNIVCITSAGLAIWEARTNTALWSNDMTQSGTWTAVNMTTALNAVGPDNIANSASTITASAINATIIQLLTSASTQRAYSFYILCVTCTGTISAMNSPVLSEAFTALSTSNCFNASNVGTAPNTNAWVRCFLTATALNPAIGFQIANSGDSVQVFCNQLEAASFRSPCVPTTSGTAARAQDSIAATGALLSALKSTNGTVLAKTSGINLSIATSSAIVGTGPGAFTSLLIAVTASSNVAEISNGVQALDTVNTFTGGTDRAGASWTTGSRQIGLNSGAIASDANGVGSVTSIKIGSLTSGSSGGNTLNANLQRLVVFPFNVSSAALASAIRGIP